MIFYSNFIVDENEEETVPFFFELNKNIFAFASNFAMGLTGVGE